MEEMKKSWSRVIKSGQWQYATSQQQIVSSDMIPVGDVEEAVPDKETFEPTYEEGVMEGRRQIQEIAKQVQEGMNHHFQLMASCQERMSLESGEVFSLALAMVSKILPEALTKEPAAVIEYHFSQLKLRYEALLNGTLYVHPEVLPLLKEIPEMVKCMPDPSLQLGEWRFDSPITHFDGRLASILAEIQAELERYVG